MMAIASTLLWLLLPLLAAYVAHRKGRGAVLPAILTFVAPPVGLLVTLLMTPHASSGRPSNAALRVGVGLLPLWIAIVMLIGGGLMSPSHDYWNVAPWIVLLAIPACIVTLALVEVFGGRKVDDAG